VVIAYFSRAKALTYTLGIIVACSVLYGITLYHPANVTLTEYLNSKGLFRFYSALIFWILAVVVIFRQLVILNQIVFHGSEAIWTSERRLYYTNFGRDILYHSIRCGDVDSIYRNTSDGPMFRGIVLRLRSGAEIKIPCALFRESEETILANLQQACTDN